ncbi:uncharacterized protein LOC121666419 [Corvus kubaryi]|uniref:uncharacterized protein LOC121666419 n=1 Tax=Corvus kubaryi TaxID=68294 RepID=UPI001C03C22B|nr:uncharacterized protein LOC121666419 [Corvus kubaryi]
MKKGNLDEKSAARGRGKTQGRRGSIRLPGSRITPEPSREGAGSGTAPRRAPRAGGAGTPPLRSQHGTSLRCLSAAPPCEHPQAQSSSGDSSASSRGCCLPVLQELLAAAFPSPVLPEQRFPEAQTSTAVSDTGTDGDEPGLLGHGELPAQLFSRELLFLYRPGCYHFPSVAIHQKGTGGTSRVGCGLFPQLQDPCQPVNRCDFQGCSPRGERVMYRV